MKLTAVLLFAACMQVAARTEGQTVTLKVKNAPMKEVFREIQKQTGLNVMVDEVILEKAGRVTLDVRDMPVPQVLNICLKNEPLTYTIVDGRIVVKPAPTVVFQPTVTSPPLPPPPIDVKGRVTNEDGEPVRATVTVKGTNIAVGTNDNGEFELKGVDGNATLVITGVSIETKEIKIAGKTNLTIVTKTSIKPLDAVIINKGYYTTSQRLNTGSVAKVTAEDLGKQPVGNVLAGLEGRMPGVYISQNTGVAGGSFTIQVRGRNSIRAGNDPLYIIDGVPFTSTPLGSSQSVITLNGSPLASINPADIESVEVLKDGDATAIYGSRGANGVVLITTKKGRSGKTKVDINMYSGFGKVANKLDLLNTQQYLEMRHEAFNNDLETPQSWDHDINGDWDTTRYTDWQKVLIGGTAKVTDGQVSISGGNTNTQFLIGGGYRRETTVFPTNFADKKASVHFNITNVSTNQKFKAILSGSYLNDDNNLMRDDPTYAAMQLAPDAPAGYSSSDKINWDNFDDNPFAPFRRTYNMNTDNLIGNALLSYEIVPGLTAKSNLGYTKLQAKELTVNPLSSYNPAWGIPSGYTYFGNSSAKTWIVEPQLEYQKKIGKNKLIFLLGSTFQENIKQSSLLLGRGFLDDALLTNIAAATTITKASSSSTDNYYQQYKYQAIFARINYNWHDKYLLNLTGRRDGSSRFGPGKQFANFGAAGAAWIFSEENFIKNKLSFISYGKLRASYGSTGNDQIADYGYLSTYSTTSYPYSGSGGLYPNRLFNPDYAWEMNKKIEAGIEIGLLNDRVLISTDYYRNRSSNQLVGLALPGITGFTSIQGNLPAIVQNNGWEFSLSTINIKTSNFSWNTSFNITIPRNKLVSYPNIESSNYAYTYAVGQPLSILFKYHLTGVDPTTGDYTFEDVDNNGNISFPNDTKFLKKITQNFYGGLQNKINYKSWQLDFLFQFVKQTGYNYQQGFNMPGLFNANQPTIVLSRWQHTGDLTTIERFSQSYSSSAYDAYSNSQYSADGTVNDASFIRFKNLALSYTFQQKKLQALHIENYRIYIQAQNLLTITNYIGLDPETQSSSSLPPLRVITAGFQLTF